MESMVKAHHPTRSHFTQGAEKACGWRGMQPQSSYMPRNNQRTTQPGKLNPFPQRPWLQSLKAHWFKRTIRSHFAGIPQNSTFSTFLLLNVCTCCHLSILHSVAVFQVNSSPTVFIMVNGDHSILLPDPSSEEQFVRYIASNLRQKDQWKPKPKQKEKEIALFLRSKIRKKHMQTQGRYSQHILKPTCSRFWILKFLFSYSYINISIVLLVTVLKYLLYELCWNILI